MPRAGSVRRCGLGLGRGGPESLAVLARSFGWEMVKLSDVTPEVSQEAAVLWRVKVLLGPGSDFLCLTCLDVSLLSAQ